MSTPVKLAGFLLALVVVFVAARGVGAVTGPVAASTQPMAHNDMAGAEDDHGDEAGHAEERARSRTLPPACRSPRRATPSR